MKRLSELRALLASNGAQVDEQDYPTMAKIVRTMPLLLDVAEAAAKVSCYQNAASHALDAALARLEEIP